MDWVAFLGVALVVLAGYWAVLGALALAFRWFVGR